MNAARPKLEEWDLPSDADMLRWIQAKGATVGPCLGMWIVALGEESVAEADTIHTALERAMKEHP